MILLEGLDYHDMKNQVLPTLSVDEYAAKMGDDSNIVTLSFIVKAKQAGKDLVSWFEIGYDYVLDASLSDGELEPGLWLVFVELKRKSNISKKIIELLKDLKTLTDLDVKDWTIKVNDEEYDANEDILKQVIVSNPNDYKKEQDGELNEMREIAGLQTKNIHDIDDEIKKYISAAGL